MAAATLNRSVHSPGFEVNSNMLLKANKKIANLLEDIRRLSEELRQKDSLLQNYMDLAGSQSQRLATLNQTLQDTLPWNPEKPASCSTPNAGSTWSEVVVRGYQKGPSRSLSTQAPGLNLVNRFAALADDNQAGESPQRPPLNPKLSAVTHEAEPSATPQNMDPNSSASVIPRRPGVERQIKMDTEINISRKSPVISHRSSTSSSRRRILLKNAVLRRRPGGLPSLDSQRSISPTEQKHKKEASPVQPGGVDSANSEPHMPPPRPLFAPTTLIVGDSIIRHVRFFNAVTRCFPGSTVRDILERLPGILKSLPTTVFRLIVHVGCNDTSHRESEKTKADFMDLINFLKNCGKTVLISGPLPGLSRSTERFSRLLDDILQKEAGPLCAAEVGSELQKQFAILPGGRGTNGSPIIIFPEYPDFSDVKEEELQNVLSYLTSVPSTAASGEGFILVIDRRQDRWTAVRATLLRIAGSFPGILHLVLVLRPTTFFQRTISDLQLRFIRDDFKMKVPVVMLSSVTELHAYIDPGQLTTEVGGTQDYNHDSWISHRTAIEAFALMVKTIAQTLQAFGTELAETELPNDAEATTNLLQAHTCKKEQMKEDLQVALSQGRRLLDIINEPLLVDPEYNMTHDEMENLATVQRLIGQLDETETAFEDFWERHRTKLEQCLQLRHFEHHFREIRAQLDVTSERLSGFSEVSVSPAHAEHVLQELSNHEDKAFALLDVALSLAGEGDGLIENSHYAEDSIRPKCRELRDVCEEISSTLRHKKSLLLRALELHHALEKASGWCEEGIFLLASQPVDRCQSQDGAEAALQELERYLDTAALHTLTDRSAICCQYETVLNTQLRDQIERVFQKQISVQEMFEKRRVSLKKLAAKQTRPVQPVAPRPEVKSPLSSPSQERKERRYSADSTLCKKGESPVLNGGTRHASLSEEEESLAVLRRHVMNELLETERAYVEELLCVLEGYAAEMDNPAMAHLIPSTLHSKKDILFGNMSEIYHFHKRTFLKELEAYTDCPELVGRCFLERMKDLQIYEAYCQNKPRSESLWRQCSDCAFFQECQKKLEHKLGLDSYLLKPVQRITKYQLLLKELLKYSKGCDGSNDLQEALSSILGILKAVNDSMHLIAITGYEGNLSELGRLLMQGSFSVWTEHKKGHAKVKDLARFKPMQRHLFLHQKALLFCKKREENGEGYEKAPSYSFKHSLSMSAVGITENAKGDNKKFEIWCNSREEVFIVQAPTPEIKTSWVNEIRKVLTQQLKACRDARQPKSADSVSPSTTTTSSSSSSICLSPFRSSAQRNQKKQEEKKAEPNPASDTNSCSSPKHKGWSKASLSADASEENDGYSSGEDPMNSDTEEDAVKKLAPGKYTVVADCEKAGPQELSVKSGDVVQLIREGEEGQWFVKNLRTQKEGWVAAANLLSLISESKSSQSLSSSDGSVSGNLSTSSSCSETYTSFSDIKP